MTNRHEKIVGKKKKTFLGMCKTEDRTKFGALQPLNIAQQHINKFIRELHEQKRVNNESLETKEGKEMLLKQGVETRNSVSTV